MSWWVSLEKRKKTVKVNLHKEGGTYCVGGTMEAELNVTYNYSTFYYKFLNKEQGLKWLDGKKAGDCIIALSKAVILLGDTRDSDDYWAKTPGNAGHALDILLGWAKQYPKAKFCVA